MHEVNYSTEHVTNLLYRHREEKEPSKSKTLEEQIAAGYDRIDAALKQYSERISTEEEAADFKAVQSHWAEFMKTPKKHWWQTRRKKRRNPAIYYPTDI